MQREMIDAAQNCIEICAAWIDMSLEQGDEKSANFWRGKLCEYQNELDELNKAN